MPGTTSNERPKSTTVTTRIPVHLKERWQRAAVIRGVTLTDFMITAANNATTEVFREEERIELSARDRKMLCEMLSRPPQPIEGIKTAVGAWRNHKREREEKNL